MIATRWPSAAILPYSYAQQLAAAPPRPRPRNAPPHLQPPAAVDGHDPVADGVGGGVQAHCHDSFAGGRKGTHLFDQPNRRHGYLQRGGGGRGAALSKHGERLVRQGRLPAAC